MEITALTKIGALLEAHPELEQPLIDRVPTFEKLRNPILRATVAKLATLEQAAKVGSIPLPDLLAFLRRQLGQTGVDPTAGGPSSLSETWPPWYRPDAVVAELDAAAMLAQGSHPLAAVKQALASRPPGAIVVVISDFEPAPLLEQLSKEGMLTACVKAGPVFRTCLRRP
jgi:hypothetical protein